MICYSMVISLKKNISWYIPERRANQNLICYLFGWFLHFRPTSTLGSFPNTIGQLLTMCQKIPSVTSEGRGNLPVLGVQMFWCSETYIRCVYRYILMYLNLFISVAYIWNMYVWLYMDILPCVKLICLLQQFFHSSKSRFTDRWWSEKNKQLKTSDALGIFSILNVMRISHDDPSIHKNLSKAKNALRCQGVLCQHDSCLENLGRAKFLVEWLREHHCWDVIPETWWQSIYEYGWLSVGWFQIFWKWEMDGNGLVWPFPFTLN